MTNFVPHSSSDVTDSQIAALADEAAAAGDDAQVAICQLALGIDASDREQREARLECERVIRAAQAMAD